MTQDGGERVGGKSRGWVLGCQGRLRENPGNRQWTRAGGVGIGNWVHNNKRWVLRLQYSLT